MRMNIHFYMVHYHISATAESVFVFEIHPGTYLLSVLWSVKSLQRFPIRWTCGLWVSSFSSVCTEGR